MHRELARMIDASICFFAAYHAQEQRVEVLWQIQDGVELEGGSFPLGNGLTSQVIRERQARLVSHWSQQGPFVQVQYATAQPGLPQSAITVPALVDGRVLGVLSVQDQRPGAFDETHLDIVQRLVDRATPSIAAVLEPERSKSDNVVAASDLSSQTALPDDAAIALDSERRLVSMNEAARALLSLRDGSVVFGWPIDRPHAQQWPLGSGVLSEALQAFLDRLQRGEGPREIEFAVHGDVERVVRCTASEVVRAGLPAGSVLRFYAAETPAA
jgi:PAS domain-containing protein